VTTPPPIAVPDQFATVRTNPITGAIDYLGVVGSKYVPLQNEASCTLLDALTEEGGAVYETAGALRGGRETFVTMKLPTSMTFEGPDGTKDRTDWYLAALNSHDGSSAFRFLLTPIRIVCANTQAAAIARAKASFAIRHTGGARGAINEARTALGLSWRYMEAFETEAAALYAAPMDVEEVRDFAAELVKIDQAPSAAARTRRREQVNGIVKLFVSSPTVQPIGGTRWAAYNAVTEFVDHVAPVRGTRNSAEAADARALRAVTTGSSAQLMKVEAFRMLQTV
jgi:phage/plasmid-like protein (TIGR03299 family)